MIKTLVYRYGSDNATFFDMWFVPICLLGFSGFLRIEELLQIKTRRRGRQAIAKRFAFHANVIKHEKIKESHLDISVSKSKTDQHRKSFKVYIFGIKPDCFSAKTLKKN